VTGGTGGLAGIVTGGTGTGGIAGAGGAGLVGGGLTIINNGTIQGGLGGDGVTRADAIIFTGGANFLTGTGTVGSFTMISGGTFAPGSGIAGSSMTISGNLAFQAGAIYLVQVSPSTASFANVSGSATLAGSVQAVFAPGNYVTRQYTILHSSGLTGTFSGVSGNVPAGFAESLSYTATDAFLNLFASLGTGGLSGNQGNVANALNSFFNNGGTLPPSFVSVFGLTGGNLGTALTQLSGEAATGTQQTTFDAMNMFMSTMLDPSNRGPASTPGGGVNGYASAGDASAYASDGRKRTNAERDAYAMFTKVPPQNFEARWNVWAAGFGGSQTTDGNATTGSNGATSRIAGTAVGADYLFSPNTIAGFALAGGGTNYVVGNGIGGGRSDLFQAGVYARHTMGAAYIAGALAYGWQDITTNRSVTLAGLDQLQARFNANAFSGRVEGGYRFVSPWIGGVGITPYAAAQFTTFDLPAYAEQAIIGTNNFALAYGAKSVTDPRSELGLRADKSFAMPDGVLTLRGRLAWAHDYDPDRSISATFQSLPGASFVVNGAAQASDSVLTTVAIERKWINNWSIAATFEGEFSSVTTSYAGKGVVRYVW
jgi:uncharacterized protein with beta-barrel porin domain